MDPEKQGSFHALETKFSYYIFFLFWPCHTACGILVPKAGIEPAPFALEAQGPEHWNIRKVPKKIYLEKERV